MDRDSEHRGSVAKKLESQKQVESSDEWIGVAEEAIDAIEDILNHPILSDYSATVVLDTKDEGVDVLIEIEGGGSEKYRDLIDKQVHLAMREARNRIEKRFKMENSKGSREVKGINE